MARYHKPKPYTKASHKGEYLPQRRKININIRVFCLKKSPVDNLVDKIRTRQSEPSQIQTQRTKPVRIQVQGPYQAHCLSKSAQKKTQENSRIKVTAQKI
jgi:hypothetical protein